MQNQLSLDPLLLLLPPLPENFQSGVRSVRFGSADRWAGQRGIKVLLNGAAAGANESRLGHAARCSTANAHTKSPQQALANTHTINTHSAQICSHRLIRLVRAR